MTLIEQLLYELEGEAAVRGDASTNQLEALLAAARKLSPFSRMKLQAEVTRLRREAAVEAELRRSVRADLLARATEWELRAASAPPTFAEQAKERVAGIQQEAEGVAAEISEYEATVQQLDEISGLLDRLGPA